jgi:hypothetical protein
MRRITLNGKDALMEFRWIALLALWTLLSGPILAMQFKASPGTAVRPDAIRAQVVAAPKSSTPLRDPAPFLLTARR